jgi:hypothetical protein
MWEKKKEKASKKNTSEALLSDYQHDSAVCFSVTFDFSFIYLHKFCMKFLI